MRVGAKSFASWILPLAVLAACAALIVTDFDRLAARIRGLEFDTYQRALPRPYEDTAAHSGFHVRVLDADDASIARFGPWPWPHSVLAKLADELKNAGAAIVVFAFPLDKPEFLPQAGAGPAPADLPAAPGDAFTKSIAQMKSVTGFTLGEAGARAPAIKTTIAFSGADSPLRAITRYRDALPALPAVESASAGVGSLNMPPDADGKVRGVPMVLRLNETAVPSVEGEAIRIAAGVPAIVIRSEETGLPGVAGGIAVAGMTAGNFDVPLSGNGALEIWFSGPHEERDISAAALDEGNVAAGALKNAIVFFASPNAAAVTPDGRLSAAEIRAEAMENLLLGDALRPASSLLAGLVFLAVAGLALVVLFARANIYWAGAFAVAAIAAAQGFSWLLFSQDHVLLDAASPNVALALVFVTGAAARMFEVSRARSELKDSFSDNLPADAIEQIAHAPAKLRLDGEARVVTALSCGIRGYAALTESFAEDPAGFTRLVNLAMAPLIDDAVSHGAMVGPFDGESFIAYWNAPLDDPEHAMRACEAASRMTMSLAEVNEQLSRERRFDGTPFEPLEAGIGIATGPAIAGGFTARGRTTYSVSGGSTVLAARIRQISGQYGPAVVVSESTREAASRGYAFLEVDFIELGPKEQPVKLYAMLGNPLVRASPKFRALATFHEHIFQSLRTQQWEKTRELIEQCRKLSGASQKMYDLHLARIAWFEKHPPGSDWDGAFRAVVN